VYTYKSPAISDGTTGFNTSATKMPSAAEIAESPRRFGFVDQETKSPIECGVFTTRTINLPEGIWILAIEYHENARHHYLSNQHITILWVWFGLDGCFGWVRCENPSTIAGR